MMYKRFCHIFQVADQWYLFDVNSGSASMISGVAAKIMQQADPLDENDIMQRLSAVDGPQAVAAAWEQLCRAGLLADIPQTLRPYPEIPVDRNLSSLTLHLAHDCNLRCQYCYAGTGSYRGERGLMSQAVAAKALDLLFSHESESYNIGFFGGEPLLNVDLMKWVIRTAEERAARIGKGITFGMNTNGTMIDQDLAKYLKDHKVALAISIDGCRDHHDRMRPDSSGNGSYDRIMANILPWMNNGSPAWIARPAIIGPRVNLKESVLHLFQQGFQAVHRDFVLEADSPYAIDQTSLAEIKEQSLWLADYLIENIGAGKMLNLMDIMAPVSQLYEREFLSWGCKVGMAGCAVSPDGKLYPCHRLMGKDEHQLGTVSGVDPARKKAFLQRYADRLQGCDSCWARFGCAGRCVYQSVVAGCGIERPVDLSCAVNKIQWEVAIYTYCQLRNRGYDTSDSLFPDTTKSELAGRYVLDA